MDVNLQIVGLNKPRCGGNKRPGIAGPWAVCSLFLAVITAAIPTSCSSISQKPKEGSSRSWEEKFMRIVWVDYSPPTANPLLGVEATPEAIREDLTVLRKAGFTGLVTYGSSGVLGRDLPAIAGSQGFEGIIMGIWDPANRNEIDAAIAAAGSPIVLGSCVGNEGLGSRYQLTALRAVIEELRHKTSKPVTTTEILERYSNPDLLTLGDWVFPNAHPYFHNQLEPQDAVRWTKSAYEQLKKRSTYFVLLKEVGLPTGGDSRGRLSEEAQERYYLALAKTGVQFVYFEGFDQPWKTHLPVEPHWGIFNSDRSPKRLARWLTKGSGSGP